VARKRVEDAEAAIEQEQEDIRYADNVGLTTREPKPTCQQMLNDSRDSMSDLTRSDDHKDADDEDDEDTQLGKRGKDDEPSWMMGTISKPVQQRMERCQ